MSTWQQFISIPNGTRIFNNGWDQCVALANEYHQGVLGRPFVSVGSAYQWWTLYSSLSALHNTYTQSQTPIPGAVFVARYGIYDAPNGHIGVVLSVNGDGTFNTMEQNAGTWRYVGRYRRGMQNILGFLHPRDNPATSQEHSTPKHKKENDLLILDQDKSIYVADDLGYDSILEFGGGMANEELIYAAEALWGKAVRVNNRQRDLINSVARNRWNKKRAQIVSEVKASVGTAQVDNAAISESVSKSVIEALNKTGVSVDQATVQKAVRAELDKTKLTG